MGKKFFRKWLTGFVVLCVFVFCKGETKIDSSDKKVSATGVILFTVGEVFSGQRKLAPGDIVSETDIVKTGKKSTCDLQLRESESEAIIRLKSDSEFSLRGKKVGDSELRQGILKAGVALVNVPKKLKSNDSLEIVTPTSLAGVRGTKFEIGVSSDGSSNLFVIEGKVATRPRIADVEDLPKEIVQKNEVLANAIQSVESTEQVVEKGQSVSVKKSDTEKILKETGVSEIVAKIKPDVKIGMSPEEIQKAIEKIEKAVEASEKKEDLKKKKEIKTIPKIETIKNKDLEQKIKEVEELISIEKKKLESETSTKTAIKERNAKDKAVLMKRIEQIVGKSSERLILKDGRKLEGVIFQESGNYIVLTPDGKEIFTEEQVEGMDL
ncbi:MAG: FecR domain-containing protein [Leptospiraceae bacterium]|nr:FecR domain-containing protein [Leptospiraceae bacterium]MCK6381793.1 FecR domain-containing protein [Leptospiraceae bacterium]